jgi:GH15 family glucan-1,4-alpha-glucosidase
MMPLSDTPREDYSPISDHGLIGDRHSAALVSKEGTISWYCPSRFDNPSLFASILDADNGGFWSIRPDGPDWHVSQYYIPDTAILVTWYQRRDAAVEVVDFMPDVHAGEQQRLLRRVTCTQGYAPISSSIEPRFDYGRTSHVLRTESEKRVRLASAGLEVLIESSQILGRTNQGGIRSWFALQQDKHATFILYAGRGAEGVTAGISVDCAIDKAFDQAYEKALTATTTYWRRWCTSLHLPSRWREQVCRSAIVLKLLTYAPTGSIVAAPTTSLPEQIGGGRNWDYRYCWIRDSAWSVQALTELGSTEEAEAFFQWILKRLHERGPESHSPLQLMYTIDGGEELTEKSLFLRGYRDSRPVRIGNGAAKQLQLDIYGELLDAVATYANEDRKISDDLWKELTKTADWVAAHWDQPDEGIWETRGGKKDFVYSRLMCWVALDRALYIAEKRGDPSEQWKNARDQIRRQIWDQGWNETHKTFVQEYETTAVDAALLLMPRVKFIEPTHARWNSTLQNITEALVVAGRVNRYNTPDGLLGTEGTFTICSFWYVDALAEVGRLDEALIIFQKLLSAANHLSLYSEEIGAAGEALGNFPQGFSHLAFIHSALNLANKLDHPARKTT